MAVKVHEYFKRFKLRQIFIVAVVQLAVAAAVIAIIYYGFYWDLANVAWAIIITNVIAAPIIVYITTKPFGKLSSAVAHVSDDPFVTPLPHITPTDERTGLKALVQTVYELAATATKKPGAKSSNDEAIFAEILQNLPCGVIAYKNQEIFFANQLAPINQLPSGEVKIDLRFEQNDNLDEWLAQSRTSKVRDSRLWLRVADKLPGEENQRIFDVAAFYQKDDPTGVDTVVITFDRTQIYQRDQEDMDFIALAAHELRGPITVIRGYLDVFSDELQNTLDDEQKQLLERLEVSAERLASYVNNILNVSRFDRHQLKLNLQHDNLGEVIRGIYPEINLRAKTQRRRLSFQIPNNLPPIAADRSSLGEVITNLVDNAIKYSPENGEVVISATTKQNEVELTVQDQGMGIPESVVGNLFTRFYRSHKSRQAVGGTGLGLYICKAIVEMHGGKIWVRTAEGQGSTFGVILPTYASVADKLKTGDNTDITQRPEGWIKNHAMIRR